MRSPSWHIAGIGAMGGLLAGLFSESGQGVRLIFKTADQLASYQNTGLKINDISYYPDAIDIQHLGDEPIRGLICTVKAYDITPLLCQLNKNLNENSLIILIHNGLGVLDEIKAQLPHLRIICGLSTLGAHMIKPFTVKAFLKGKINIGPAIGTFSPEEINTIVTAFHTSSIAFKWDENIETRMLEKFAVNCSINLLTAIFNCKNGALLHYQDLLKQLTHEITRVLNPCGLQMTGSTLLTKVTQIIQMTADNYSSMHQDVQRQKPTELAYLNSYLIKLAMQHQIDTPMTDALLKQFKPQRLSLT